MPSIDRLSCLPDELICQILSFLPTKLSARTSVLSKRWSFLWAHVPSLEFYLNDRDCQANSEIMNKIVLQRKRYIHRLRLHGNFEGTEKELESWIVNIPNLVISLRVRFGLPQCLFTCKTVVDLQLHCLGYIPVLRSGIYLPALKKLKLDGSRYQCNESLAHLLSGCPVLEDFTFNGKVWVHFCVSSSTLTRLVLRFVNANILKFGLELDTPALRYLQLECYMPDKFSVGALGSLVEADINLLWDNRHQDSLLYSRNVLALVGELHNVSLLCLKIDWTVMIHGSAFFASGIKFHNLTKLYLSANLGFITSFLENANNLQVLRLVIHRTDDVWTEPKRVPACLLSHLQTVNICYFGYSEEEFDIIRYILMNAKVLKRMEIFGDFDSKEKPVALKRLASFGRGSQECELVFDGDCLGEAFLESTN